VKMGGKSFFFFFFFSILRGFAASMFLCWSFFLVVARKQDLDDTVAIHPTSGEGVFFSSKSN
jgi:hypothetical protein